MSIGPTIVTTDLEGVFVPEIWIAVAEKTGIADLRLTTRDLPDYDELMRRRLAILQARGITLADIQAVIATLEPLPGAGEFFQWLRSRTPCLIVSDTFYEFAAPLMAKLGYPTLLCNSLEVDRHNMIVGYRLRQQDGKRHVVRALHSLQFRVIAVGDSYNDTTMLGEADAGILFRAPDNVIAEFPHFPLHTSYDELQTTISALLARAEEERPNHGSA